MSDTVLTLGAADTVSLSVSVTLVVAWLPTDTPAGSGAPKPRVTVSSSS